MTDLRLHPRVREVGRATIRAGYQPACVCGIDDQSEPTGMMDEEHILVPARQPVQRKDAFDHGLRVPSNGAEDNGLTLVQPEDLLWDDTRIGA